MSVGVSPEVRAQAVKIVTMAGLMPRKASVVIKEDVPKVAEVYFRTAQVQPTIPVYYGLRTNAYYWRNELTNLAARFEMKPEETLHTAELAHMIFTKILPPALFSAICDNFSGLKRLPHDCENDAVYDLSNAITALKMRLYTGFASHANTLYNATVGRLEEEAKTAGILLDEAVESAFAMALIQDNELQGTSATREEQRELIGFIVEHSYLNALKTAGRFLVQSGAREVVKNTPLEGRLPTTLGTIYQGGATY